jgi:prepilin-type N-terminal cleavage/methylation domain-containing protein
MKLNASNSWHAAERRAAQLAFTLIEILIAIGIFAMVMVAIYSSWSAIMRGSRVALTAAAEVQRTRIAMRALQESLSSCVMYADNSKYYGFFADTGGNFAYLSFVARLPESFPGSGMFPGQPLRRFTLQVDE